MLDSVVPAAWLTAPVRGDGPASTWLASSAMASTASANLKGWQRVPVWARWLALGLVVVVATWALATWWPAQAQAAAAAAVGVAVVAVTWRYANLTDGMRREMSRQNDLAREQLEEARYLREQERHAVLASFQAQLGRWHSFTSQGRPPHMPMSLGLYGAAAQHLWRLWDEVRADFVDIEPRIQALNEEHAAKSQGHDAAMLHLATLLHPTLNALRDRLRAYLFEFVVGCGALGSDHCWRINYDQAHGHDLLSLQLLFEGKACPTCGSPLIVRELGYDAGWRDAGGEYRPRAELDEWPDGTVAPVLPGPALH